MTQKIINAVLALGLVAVALLFALGSGRSVGASINHYENGFWQFGNGIYAGLLQQLSIDSAGNVSTSGSLTAATSTFDGPVLSSPGVLSTTTMGTATTLKEADLLYNEYWNVVLNAASNHTFTLPASSTLTTFIPNAGDRRVIYVKLASTTAASTTASIFATGAGIDIEAASSTGAKVFARNTAKLEFIRDVSTDITLIVTSFMDAD
jgi:hypothetical protein